MVLVFLSIMNYLIDSYVIFAASVLAANAVLRSLFGAAFPLFTPYMYDDLGIHWASTIPAFLALACVPFPFLFYKYGPAIRSRCKYAAQAQAFLERIRGQAAKEPAGDSGPTDQSDDAAGGPIRDMEAEREAEAIDHSYDAEENQPGFEAIRPHGDALHRLDTRKSTRSVRSTRSTRSITYEASPFDIDRVNTNETFSGRHSRSRAGSIGVKK